MCGVRKKNIMDSVGHATRHPTKEDGKVTKKKRQGNPEGWEVHKGKRVLLKQTLRDGGKMIGTQRIRMLKIQQPLRNVNMLLSVNCDFRVMVQPNTLNVFSLTDWIIRSEHAKLVLLPITLLHVDNRFTKILYLDVRTQAETVYDPGKRIFCTLGGTGKPMVIETRKVKCRRPLMAVIEMTDCGRWVCFGPQRQGFSVDSRKGQKIDFTPTLGEWDLTMTLEPPERRNKKLNKAFQEISAKKRAVAVTRDYGAITDTDGLVRIMGCDLLGGWVSARKTRDSNKWH